MHYPADTDALWCLAILTGARKHSPCSGGAL
jgi:hypothetical protein